MLPPILYYTEREQERERSAQHAGTLRALALTGTSTAGRESDGQESREARRVAKRTGMGEQLHTSPGIILCCAGALFEVAKLVLRRRPRYCMSACDSDRRLRISKHPHTHNHLAGAHCGSTCGHRPRASAPRRRYARTHTQWTPKERASD